MDIFVFLILLCESVGAGHCGLDGIGGPSAGDVSAGFLGLWDVEFAAVQQ